ncbi:MAG: hypothetical protein PHW02_07320 [bacterium]|nr:hypothetical protein [bacterium]
MKKTLFAILSLSALLLFSQEIKTTYAVIDELYENENFSMVLKINEGAFMVKEVYLILTDSDLKEKRFKMDLSDKIASVSVDSKLLPEKDFTYFFEVARKDNEIVLFPKLLSERFKNKVIRKKQEIFKKTEAILLSPADETNLIPKDFLFAVYIDGKAKNINLIVDGEDVTDKCIVGKNLLTYNPGRIFQPRKYRFDVINDGALLQTYYFNFASSGFLKSLFRGSISIYSKYDGRNSSSPLASALLSFYGGVSSFEYKTRVSAGNSSELSVGGIEDFYSCVKLASQSIEAGIIRPASLNSFESHLSYMGLKARVALWKFFFTFGTGDIYDRLYAVKDEKEGRIADMSFGITTSSWKSLLNFKRSADISRGDYYTDFDNAVISHSHSLFLFREALRASYSGGLISTRSSLFTEKDNIVSKVNLNLDDSLLLTYSQRVNAALLLKYLTAEISLSDISEKFNSGVQFFPNAGGRNISLKLKSPLFDGKITLGGDADCFFEKSSLSYDYMNPQRKNIDFYAVFSQMNMPLVSLNYTDREWSNMTADSFFFKQRMYGFSSAISGDFFVGNAKTTATLLIEQMNWKLTPNDSNNFSSGSVSIDVNSNLFSSFYAGISASGRIKKSAEGGAESNRFKGRFYWKNLFDLLTPELSFTAELTDDTNSLFNAKYLPSASVIASFGNLNVKASVSEIIMVRESEENRRHLVASGNIFFFF